MTIIVTLILGFIIGFFTHIIAMKISFKQRTIDYKIKIYDSIITSWVKTRNQIYSEINPDIPNEKWYQLEKLYGKSQAYIAEALLVSEDTQLAIEINEFNEKFYRQNWHQLSLTEANNQIAQLKTEAINFIQRMRNDIKESTVLNRNDFNHVFQALFKKN